MFSGLFLFHIVRNFHAFATVNNTCTNFTSVIEQLSSVVRHVFGNCNAFAAVRNGGSVS